MSEGLPHKLVELHKGATMSEDLPHKLATKEGISNVGPKSPTARAEINYLYYCGRFLLSYNGPQNPVLIIKAPIFNPKPRSERR